MSRLPAFTFPIFRIGRLALLVSLLFVYCGTLAAGKDADKDSSETASNSDGKDQEKNGDADGDKDDADSKGDDDIERKERAITEEETKEIPDWHLVDVPMLQCGQQPPTEVVLNVTTHTMALHLQDLAHIITFYRTSSKKISVEFEALDNFGGSIVPRKTVDLIPISKKTERHNDGDDDDKKSDDTNKDSSDSGKDNSDSDKKVVSKKTERHNDGDDDDKKSDDTNKDSSDTDKESKERRLGDYLAEAPARLLARMGSFFGSRGARNVFGRSSRTSLRTRGSSLSGGGAAFASVAALKSGSNIRGWRNPNCPGAYLYGYMYLGNELLNSFPDGHEETEYGYSGSISASMIGEKDGVGTSSVSAEGEIRVPLSLPQHANEIARSARGEGSADSDSFASRWATLSSEPLGEECQYGTRWHGKCKACYDKYGEYSCATPWAPPPQITRDNLMNTGFVPGELSSPLRIVIYKVDGEDYSADRICPPKNWEAHKAHLDKGKDKWTPPDHQDLFVTITAVDTISEGKTADEITSETLKSGDPIMIGICSALGCCALCSMVFFICALKKVLSPEAVEEASTYQNIHSRSSSRLTGADSMSPRNSM